MNYSNKDSKSRPFLKRGGKLQDAVRPKCLRHYRVHHKNSQESADELYLDLVKVFANHGITLQNVKTLARDLVKIGWTKVKRIQDDKG